VDSGPGSAAD